LQAALRRQVPCRQIEALVQAAIQTHRYWNQTFGPFFGDLVEHYDSVPARIKGWFVCIAIPWLLGSLMLADLLDFIDKKEMGHDDGRRERLGTSLVSNIRKSSAIDLSSIARVSKCLSTKESQPIQHMPDLHFAVNEGATLTEPWTMILIQAFTKAAVFHLDGAVNEATRAQYFLLGQGSREMMASMAHCQNCIEALWFLGRKSQLARNLATVLSQAFRSVFEPRQLSAAATLPCGGGMACC
jgi:hypothetical protein